MAVLQNGATLGLFLPACYIPFSHLPRGFIQKWFLIKLFLVLFSVIFISFHKKSRSLFPLHTLSFLSKNDIFWPKISFETFFMTYFWPKIFSTIFFSIFFKNVFPKYFFDHNIFLPKNYWGERGVRGHFCIFGSYESTFIAEQPLLRNKAVTPCQKVIDLYRKNLVKIWSFSSIFFTLYAQKLVQMVQSIML